MRTNRLLPFSLAFLFLSFPVRAQVGGELPLEAQFPDGSARLISLVPSAAQVLFPSSKVLLGKINARVNLPSLGSGLIENVQFVTVTARPAFQRSKAAAKKHLQNLPRITAAAYDNKIFLLNELFCGENTAVFNALLRSLGANVDSAEKALEAAKFYLQLAYYRFDDLNDFIASSFASLPSKQIEFPGQSVPEIRSAVHPPVVTRDGNTYKADLITYDHDAAFVVLHHWSMTILHSQITDAREEVLVPQHMSYRVGEPPSNSITTPVSPASNLRFRLSLMADGKTPDSKELNVSTYAFTTSDGPQVIRSVCYFKSLKRSLTEMHNQLQRASQILEQGKWTDENGSVLGERALVVNSVKGSNRLEASVLLRRDSRFFEISSSCLRNALEFEKVWFHSQPSSK